MMMSTIITSKQGQEKGSKPWHILIYIFLKYLLDLLYDYILWFLFINFNINDSHGYIRVYYHGYIWQNFFTRKKTFVIYFFEKLTWLFFIYLKIYKIIIIALFTMLTTNGWTGNLVKVSKTVTKNLTIFIKKML